MDGLHRVSQGNEDGTNETYAQQIPKFAVLMRFTSDDFCTRCK